ncbi:Uncharacterised protein [Vibrio cholerae]|nr:Uncharacterised protein [Vibrio cholerae]CSI82054.1 Uncharacterised protein [Vibrio cholerae]
MANLTHPLLLHGVPRVIACAVRRNVMILAKTRGAPRF